MAFAAISCGVYGYPLEEAAQIALRTVIGVLRRDHQAALLQRIIFCCFDHEVVAIYESLLPTFVQAAERQDAGVSG